MEERQREPVYGYIKAFLTFILYLAIFTSFFFTLYRFVIPNADEYDDPNTKELQESFPWEPHIWYNSSRVLELFLMGAVRHMALLPYHVRIFELISIIGYIFFVLFIYRIRNTFLSGEKIGIHNYVEWGIGSIVGAIINLAGTSAVRRETDVAIAIVLFSLACLILYLIHPHVGFFTALKMRIQEQ